MWYIDMLKQAREEGIVVHLSTLWDTYFEGGRDHRMEKCSATYIPYMDGDYWPGGWGGGPGGGGGDPECRCFCLPLPQLHLWHPCRRGRGLPMWFRCEMVGRGRRASLGSGCVVR